MTERRILGKKKTVKGLTGDSSLETWHPEKKKEKKKKKTILHTGARQTAR